MDYIQTWYAVQSVYLAQWTADQVELVVPRSAMMEQRRDCRPVLRGHGAPLYPFTRSVLEP